MTSKTPNKFTPEVRARTVRMVTEHGAEHPSRWAAVSSMRPAIYMPALVAIRFNRDLHDKYQQLLKAGKAKKVAITAIMRRMVILANTLLREKRDWQPTRP